LGLKGVTGNALIVKNNITKQVQKAARDKEEILIII
jgi:hypothetical protein